MPEKWMRPDEVADHIGISVKTLANWRVFGDGPDFVKVGRLVRYEPSAVDAWQRAQVER
jgi:predicted DNA-binding transcriptional regulator AlpA